MYINGNMYQFGVLKEIYGMNGTLSFRLPMIHS